MSDDALSGLLLPDRLDSTLRETLPLGRTRVREVAIESSRETVLSRIVRLSVGYEGEAPSLPTTLIFKTSHPERVAIGWNGGRREVAFYRDIASRHVDRPGGALVPQCLDAGCDEATTTWHLLLEDLTATHATPGNWPLPPTHPVCEAIVETHARHQALHWDDPGLAFLFEDWRWRDDASMGAYLEQLAAQVAGFAERQGDRLPADRVALLHRLIDAAPRLARRYADRCHLTVVQGDSHVWNCFLPRDGGSDARLFDWDSWRLDIGANDLAYMMAVHWYPDRRRRFERPLIERYQARLEAEGVRDYSRDAAIADYRFCVLWKLFSPVSQEAYGVPPVIWWNNLERVWLAVEDLDCKALLRA